MKYTMGVVAITIVGAVGLAFVNDGMRGFMSALAGLVIGLGIIVALAWAQTRDTDARYPS